MTQSQYRSLLLSGVIILVVTVAGHGARTYGDEAISAEAPTGSGPAGRVVSVSEHRQTHEVRTAFLLNAGRLFLPGSGTIETSLWDPQARAWRTVGRAPYCHSGSFTGTLLADGKVLIAGGMEEGNICEKLKTSIWDLAEEKHAIGPALLEGRASHTATLQDNGTVLFVGGRSNDFGKMRILNSVELFEGAAFKALPPLKVARMQHTATRLKDGRILVAGGAGRDGRSVAAVEIWDPVRFAWESARPMRNARRTHTAHLLLDGRVMVTGGLNNASLQPTVPDALGRTMNVKDRGDQAIASTEIWDPSSDQWQPGPPLLMPSAWHSAATLHNGNILLIAPPLLGDKGNDRSDLPSPPVMLWDRKTGVWQPAGYLEQGVARSPTTNNGVTDSAGLPIVPLEDGGALIIARKQVLRWIPEKSTGSLSPIYPGRSAIEARLPDGRLLLTGGRDHLYSRNNQFANEQEKAAKREAYYRQSMHDRLSDHRSFPSAPSGMQVGQPESLAVTDGAEIFDPRNGRFSLTGRMHQPRRWHEALTLSDGRVVVAGGLAASADSPEDPQPRSSEVWDPKTGSWRVLRSELRFEAQQKVYLNQLRDGRVLFFVVRVTERENETAFRAVLWHPDRDTVEIKTVSARSQHFPSVAVLDDGRVLIVGSRETQIWDSRSGNVSALESPGVPKAFWRTRVLRNRQVLFLQSYAGELDGGRESAARLWDPASGRWAQLAELPGPYYIGKRLVEMNDGSIYVEAGDQAFLLPANTMSWLKTPRAAFDTYHNTLSDSIAQSLQSGQSMQFAWLDPENKIWVKLPRTYVPRKRPALAAFDDGRVLVAGGERESLVQVWNPRDNSWTEVAPLSRPYSSANLVRLDAKRFLFVGRDSGTDLGCEVFHVDDNRWIDCGKFSSHSKFVLGPFGQSRAVLLFGNREAAVYNAYNKTWTASRIETGVSKQPPQQAEARVAQARDNSPFTRVWNPESQTWVDVTSIAAPWRDHYRAVNLKDGRLLKSDRSIWQPDSLKVGLMPTTSPADPPLGAHLHVLPDGCVLSWAPFYLISADASRNAYLPEPYIGIQEASSLLLADGTILLAGIAAGSGQTGEGMVRIKASCSGVQLVGGGLSEMPGAKTQPKPLELEARAAPETTPRASQSNWMSPWLRENFWAVLAIVSMFGVLIYFRLGLWRRERR